jgi:RimJ/RimL family protein N-acetyltransferase
VTNLDTARLLLREWRATDAEVFARINADPLVGRYIRGRSETRAETDAFLSRIAEHWERWGYGLWAVEYKTDRQFIGFMGFGHHRLFPDEVEIGWRLDPRYWGRGLATEGALTALDAGWSDYEFKSVISIIHAENTASRRVAEKLGMAISLESEYDHPETGRPIPTVIYRARRPVRFGRYGQNK